MDMRWPDGLRAFRYRNFRLFFVGQLISLIGAWTQSTAQQWLVYDLTGSQLKLGVVVFAGFLPVLILSLFMGVIVDRFPRRRILLITQSWFMLMAAILAVLTFSGRITYEYIVFIAFLTGFGNALDMPARQAFFADLVEREDLFNAIALNSSVFNGARIIGPAVGGLIVARFGEAPAFAFNSISYLAVIGALLMMFLPKVKTSGDGKGLSELREGLSYLIHDRRVFGLVIMIAAFSTVSFPYLVLIPVFARDILEVGPVGYGALLAAQGVGALIGAFGLALKGDRIPKGRVLTVSRGMLAFMIAIVALSRIPILSMVALVGAGFAFISLLALTNTLIQLLVPDPLRGRVLSSYTWALGGFFPIGSLLIGSIGDSIGATKAALIAAGGSLLLTILGIVIFPETVKLD